MTHRLASADPTGTLRLAPSDWHPPIDPLQRTPSDWYPHAGSGEGVEADAGELLALVPGRRCASRASDVEHRALVAFFAWTSRSARQVRGERLDADACGARRDAAERVAAVASAVLEVCSDRVAKRDVAVFTSAVLEVCSDRVAKGAVVFVAWRVIARSVCSHLPSILPGALRTRPR
jgi:hypothetical protein